MQVTVNTTVSYAVAKINIDIIQAMKDQSGS